MSDAGDLLREAVALHQSGRLDEARTRYDQILRADERNPNALNLLGMVHHQQGRHEHAAELIARAIEAAPQVAGFHNNLGTVRLAQRRCAAAEQSFRHAIDLQPDYVEAANNLAVSLMGQGRMDEAIPLLLRCIELRPAYPSARNNLGNALRAKRMYREAVACYRDAIATRSDHAEAWANMAITYWEMRSLPEAEAAGRRAIALRPDHVDAHYALGLVLEAQGRQDEAAELLERVVRLVPGAETVRFHLAAMRGEQLRFAAAPPTYIAGLFDHYADTFDQHLVQGLQYRAPEMLRDAVEAARAGMPELQRQLDVLDAGCGTGLCAPLFKPMARTLVGVDLSSRMIHEARQRGLYDGLFVGELTEFLAERPAQFDLIVAADVLLYFGDLSAVLAAASQALRPGGLMAFTLEKHEGEGYVLRPSRRFAHSIEYLRSLLGAGSFAELSATEGTLRVENQQGMQGWVIVLRKV